MTEACQLVPRISYAHARYVLLTGLFCMVACVDAISVEDLNAAHEDAAPVQRDGGAPPADAGGVRDASATVDSGPRDASADVQPPAVDAQPPVDAGVCEDHTDEQYELFVFDSQGPTVLVGTSSAGPRVAYEFTGTVTQQGQGFPSQAAPSGTSQPGNAEQFRFLRVTNGARTWTIALRNAAGFGVRDGAQVEVKVSYEWGGVFPVHSSLIIRAEGQLALFYAIGGVLGSLPVPPELQVTQLAAACTRISTCGVSTSHPLSVSSDGAPPQVFAPGEQKQVGPFSVTHAGDDQALAFNGGPCPDGFASHTELMALRSEPLGPSGSGCHSARNSSLPGVRIEFAPDTVCRLSLAQAAAGIDIRYTVVVDADVAQVTRTDTAVSACRPEPRPQELFVFEDLAGNGQRYALLDLGLCPTRSETPFTLRAGRYEHSFHWDGTNWSGPSDTGRPRGPAFPAGSYSLQLSARGEYGPAAGGQRRAYEVIAALDLTLTP